MKETQHIEKKSLILLTRPNPGWKELARECVCFANSRGGEIYIGIEDSEILPPAAQKIDTELPHKIRKGITENSVNVVVDTAVEVAANGGEYIKITVLMNTTTIASTTDGKYFYRSADSCVPLLPDELTRLFTDKAAFIWETKNTTVPVSEIDLDLFTSFKRDIRNSQRVTIHVKQKTDEELLEHYFFVDNGFLTNLGVLWLGKRNDRARILYAPTVHFLKFDQYEQKVNKLTWEDYSLNPKGLIEAIWTQIPDWQEGVDVSDGMFRKFVPNYEEEVIRELVANALVHRPYTTRGEIFINLYPDRLEVVNPGLFPIGVTANNVLHKNLRRNTHLAQVFYDLHLIDKEGSGIDKIYQILLSNAKQIPIPFQGDDYVQFTVKRRILKEEIVALMNRASTEFNLNSKELISLGLIARYTTISAIQFSKELALPDTSNVVDKWLGRLVDLKLIISHGKTKGTTYSINPAFLKKAKFTGRTNLKRIETHRLRELIYQDIQIYGPTPIRDIHERIGKEIPRLKVQKVLKAMCTEGILGVQGKLKTTTYFINQKG